MIRRWAGALGGATLVALHVVACGAALSARRWSAEEVEAIRSLWIGELEPLSPDPSNRYADSPAAAELGQKLFFDTRLSADGEVSCGTCHQPGQDFQDGIPLGKGVGTTGRRTMPIAGTAHGAWFFWDGRADSQWAQALGPLESAVEHGGTRAQYAHLMAEHYRAEYETLFGALPDLGGVPRVAGPVDDARARRAWDALPAAKQDEITRVYANIGKAIAAYERRLEPGATRFDRYAERLIREGRAPEGILTTDEEAGLKLFVGKANCTQCHNGPLLTDDHFHNTGVPAVAALPADVGRARGAKDVLKSEFNCRGRYSDAKPDECSELEFLVPEGEALTRAYKAPSLRGVAERAPYMHAGQIATLAGVVEHYDRAPRAPAGSSDIHPLMLSRRERAQLEAYLRTLSAPLNVEPRWLESPHQPNSKEGIR